MNFLSEVRAHRGGALVSQAQLQYPIALLFFSLSSVCWAANSPVTIRVYSEVSLSSNVVSQAEEEAARIFQQAKIETLWVNCETSSPPTDSRCHDQPGPMHLVLRIIPKALRAADSIFGMAFLSGSSGVYGDVFFDPVKNLQRDCGASVARVLGYVMAHEVGHLLLGSHSHSAIGIMCASWHGEQLRMVGMGTLFFTAEQARAMQAKLSKTQAS
jgi:predicted metalloprotease